MMSGLRALSLLLITALPSAPQCLRADGQPCPPCSSACAACGPGTYGDGIARCAGCPPGTFSSATQTASVLGCSGCGIGTTTFANDTGRTACLSCAAAGKPLPRSATDVEGPDPLQCPWTCMQGYVRVADHCCSGSLAAAGMRLEGCSATSDGAAVECPAIPNGHHYDDGTAIKLDRCDDWACAFGYYRNGSACQAQPRCAPGETYTRDASSGEYVVVSALGALGCSPCSRCIAGSEESSACNLTHDTGCRVCNATSAYSVAGGPCRDVPLGYSPVRVTHASMPPFHGRPSGAAWPRTLYTYVPCAPPPPGTRFTANRQTCGAAAGDDQTCASPVCQTECSPWNGTHGFHLAPAGGCVPCEFDNASCTDAQRLSMAACGPVSEPRCVDCPSWVVDNGLGWLNPRSAAFPAACAVVCKDSFTPAPNRSACVPCDRPPPNAVFTSGCSWTCRKGFLPVNGSSLCLGCPPSPTCTIGTYLGFATPQDPCRSCAPCVTPTPNTAFTTVGQSNGPNTCRFVCVPGHFAFAGAADVFGNPISCDPCTVPRCVEGSTYAVPCSNRADASCARCTAACAPGFRVASPCTLANNTVCAPCGNGPPPASARWGSAPCVWACNKGFYLGANATTCLPCKTSAQCRPSERFVASPTGCGTCDPCPPLPSPGVAYIGDGQCGTYVLTCTTRFFPRNAAATNRSDVVLCPWACNAGFTLQRAPDGAAFAAFAYSRALDAADDPTLVLYHRETDACCTAAKVGLAQQLVGCTQYADGAVKACSWRANGKYVMVGAAEPRLSRCADFACNAGYVGGGASACARPVPTTSASTTTPANTTLAPTTAPFNATSGTPTTTLASAMVTTPANATTPSTTTWFANATTPTRASSTTTRFANATTPARASSTTTRLATTTTPTRSPSTTTRFATTTTSTRASSTTTRLATTPTPTTTTPAPPRYYASLLGGVPLDAVPALARQLGNYTVRVLSVTNTTSGETVYYNPAVRRRLLQAPVMVATVLVTGWTPAPAALCASATGRCTLNAPAVDGPAVLAPLDARGVVDFFWPEAPAASAFPLIPVVAGAGGGLVAIAAVGVAVYCCCCRGKKPAVIGAQRVIQFKGL